MQKIRYYCTLILLLTVHTANCSNVTADTLRNDYPALAQLLPKINRDLKVCDLVKQENGLLNIKVAALNTSVTQEKQKAGSERERVASEKRRRSRSHILRTVAEVGVILLILII